MGNKEYLSIYW